MKALSSLRESLTRLWSLCMEKIPDRILAIIVILLLVVAILLSIQGVAMSMYGPTVPANPLDNGFESGTVAQPPADLSDPQQDVLGWERGYWYTESISINVSNGLTERERQAMLGRTMARVEVIRKEEFTQMWVLSTDAISSGNPKQPISLELIPRQAIQNNGTNAPSLPFRDSVYEAVFLVGENVSEPEIYVQMMADAQLAHYSPSTNSIKVITGQSSRVTETVLAHELIHALQDQHGILDGGTNTIDEKQVKWTRIEGTANAVRRLYKKRCGEKWECWGDYHSQPIEHRYEGRYALRYFPYSEGADFVMNQYHDGGWDAVNQLHRQPPASTGQIIYDTYPKDPPTKVSLTDTSTDEWQRKRPSVSWLPSWLPGEQPLGYATPGPAAISMMFYRTTVDEYNRSSVVSPTGTERYDYSYRYVRGWEAGRLHVYQNDAGKMGYVWKLQWESPAEAREFVTGYRRVLAHWGGERVADGNWVIQKGPFADAFSIERRGTTVVIVNAPTVSGLNELHPTASNESV
jgi:hypothetical protein